MKRQGFTLIELMIVVVIIGILAVIAIPNYQSMQNRAKESRVTSNGHTVQLAAEDFAVQNNGTYSDAQADLLPLLPMQGMMANAFTGALTEPQFGAAATTSGQVGIVAVQQNGVNTGYSINGWGNSEEVFVFSNGN